MVAIKSHQANAFLKAPDPKLQAILFYGPDAGLVSERAAWLAKALSERDVPPGELLRLDDTDLDGDPDRLIVELQTMPMFGGRKVIRATAGRRVNAANIKPLLDGGLAGILIVEAGNLRPEEGLRPLFEKPAFAAAVACFPDEAQDLDAIVRETLGAAGLSITPDARQLLVARLGADRALSRGEIEKLALYALGKREIDADDVEAVVGDAAELTLEKAASEAASGNGSAAVNEAQRAIAAGESPQTLILFAERYFQRLHRIRADIENGRSADDAIASLRPPVHFKQKPVLSAQVRSWTLARLTDALDGIRTAAKAARLSSALEDVLTERLLLRLAMQAKANAARAARPRHPHQ